MEAQPIRDTGGRPAQSASATSAPRTDATAASLPFGNWAALATNPLGEYMIDACQRSILFLDVLRQRADNYAEHNARKAPHVLSFAAELILDGRTLQRPVNYGLVRIVPPPDVVTNPRKRPFIVFDPRAGHGPGIGGMKHDSEIGLALRAGHPCYFVGFLPDPMPGQTVEDVCVAEAKFIEEVLRRHPDAESKPCLIGNCQAGWQIMMTAAIRPDLPGPIMLAGAPLSYWAGVHGKNPMRYLGGLLGGTWTTALLGDLGRGIFDGANLVANFEAMNPANTLWQKPYNVYAKVDTEPPRFLEFEKWWGSPVLLNAEEMQAITDELFVGNKLVAGELRTRDGIRVDLRNIRSPIIVFCSHGDDITPPQQALGWILDLYSSVDDIIAAGQTIVYTLHQSIGHLGIFVSGKVATKEHGEFVQCMDLIDIMPPGLYEAVITTPEKDAEHPDLIGGKYLFQLRPRSLDDIRALGGNTPEDDLRFATAARVSEINRGLYETFWGPLVRMMSTPQSAELLRAMHPNRTRFRMFGQDNPFMQPIAAMAETVRANRQPAAEANPFLVMQRMASDLIVQGLETWTRVRDDMQEAVFLSVYGNKLLQAAVGLATPDGAMPHRLARDLLREADTAKLSAQLAQRIDQATPLECAVRALIYIRRPEGRADERGFAAFSRIAAAVPKERQIGLAKVGEIIRDQFLILRLDEERAVVALERLLPKDANERERMMAAVRDIATASGPLSAEGSRRLRRIEAMFAAGAQTEGVRKASPRQTQTEGATHGTGAHPAA